VSVAFSDGSSCEVLTTSDSQIECKAVEFDQVTAATDPRQLTITVNSV